MYIKQVKACSFEMNTVGYEVAQRRQSRMYADMSKEGMLHRRPRTVVKIMSSMCVCVF